ncbi:MAG: ATP-grasp domain-containing protein [Candidatus Dormibacteria bacterium]
MRPTLARALPVAQAALGRRRPVVVAHDIWLAAGLHRALPETALVCISATEAADVLRDRGTEVFCLAEQIGADATSGMSSLELLQHPATAAFFAHLGPTAVLSFKPSERIAAAVDGLGGSLLASPAGGARAYENKLAFVAAAERAGVPRPFWEVRQLPSTYAQLTAEFGPTFVVQGARGNAGQRTWPVSSQAEFDAIPANEKSARVRVAEYVKGTPFTASGVAFSAPGTGLMRERLPAGVEPCRQVTGVDWLTPEALGSCGNAWGADELVPYHPEVARCVRALGADLAANNYRGIFGVDFILAEDGPVVIEVNPRMVASLPLATELEVEAGRAPLLLLHMLELLDADLADLGDDAADAVGMATQVILHRLPGDSEALPRGGVYQLVRGVPTWVRPGATLQDIDNDELLLVTRRAGEPVTARKEFARIVARSPRGEATPGIRELTAAVRHGAAAANS